MLFFWAGKLLTYIIIHRHRHRTHTCTDKQEDVVHLIFRVVGWVDFLHFLWVELQHLPYWPCPRGKTCDIAQWLPLPWTLFIRLHWHACSLPLCIILAWQVDHIKWGSCKSSGRGTITSLTDNSTNFIRVRSVFISHTHFSTEWSLHELSILANLRYISTHLRKEFG